MNRQQKHLLQQVVLLLFAVQTESYVLLEQFPYLYSYQLDHVMQQAVLLNCHRSFLLLLLHQRLLALHLVQQ
jgi:hypothetical protein